MATDSKAQAKPKSKKPALYLAEYDATSTLLHAAEKIRDAGYKVFDVHSPFPVHGMDKAMGLGDSKLGLIVFPIGLTGTACAFLMMWWMNGIDYPLIVGGKPPYSLPSMVPILFELTILFSAFGSVLGMLGLNQLPRHHHPIFNSDRFNACSDDKFFISIESTDPKFDLEKTKKLLAATHAQAIELINDDDTPATEVALGDHAEAE